MPNRIEKIIREIELGEIDVEYPEVFLANLPIGLPRNIYRLLALDEFTINVR